MTTVAVEVPPADAGGVAERLVAETPLIEPEAWGLLEAVVKDALAAILESGGELIVLVSPTERDAAADFGWSDPREAIRGLRSTAPDAGEGEPPILERGLDVGSAMGDVLARIDESSPAASSAILRPLTPLVQRRHIDSAAMRLRRHEVVIGPTTGCRWYFLGVEGTNVPEPDGVEAHLTAVAMGGAAATSEIDLLPTLPGIASGREAAGTIAILEAASLAGKAIAPHTGAWLDEHGIRTDRSDPRAPLRRE